MHNAHIPDKISQNVLFFPLEATPVNVGYGIINKVTWVKLNHSNQSKFLTSFDANNVWLRNKVLQWILVNSKELLDSGLKIW